MAATTLLKSFEVAPNAGLKDIILVLPDTTDATNTLAVTLTDYGINPTGLLWVSACVHTTNGSVITVEAVTTAVSSGVLTITIPAGTDNDLRVIRLVGRADAGVFV